MSDPLITFPGISAPKYLRAFRTLGTRPDLAYLYAQPQPGSPDTSGLATLSFSFNNVTVNWTSALCDRGMLSVTTKGHYQIFTIKDRRWKWSKAYVTKAFNVRQPDGSVDSDTTASVADIAQYIFNTMGESAVDLSQIVSTEQPEMVFDHDTCADALDSLLSPRGYVIALNADDTVKVWVRGVGITLPANDDVVNASVSLDPPEVPLLLTALGKKTLVQSRLFMEPVGLDTDRSIKPVANLSYAPSGGWAGVNLETMDFISDPIKKELALSTVGKWYRVKNQSDGTFNIRGYIPNDFVVTSAVQYLPLSDELVDTTQDGFGKVRRNPAYIEGVFFQGDNFAMPAQGANTGSFMKVDRKEWKLHKALGIVQFKEIALKRSGAYFTFADVYLTCSYSVHDRVSFIKDRYYRSVNLGGIGEDIRQYDDIQRTVKLSYNGATITGVTDNKTAMNNLADLYLQSAVSSYTTQVGNLLLYRGIYPFNTDGVNLQIRWTAAVPDQGVPFSTFVSQYCEGITLLPTEKEKNFARRSRMQDDPLSKRRKNFKRDQKRLSDED